MQESTVAADDVYAWILRQPAWQQDLARRLSSRVDLDDEDYEEALRVVKAAHGIRVDAGAPAPQPMTRAALPQRSMGEPTRLLRFGNLRGVGLVDKDQALQFEPSGLTVIYGQNGAGKSSYVRALKALSRTVDRDCRVRASIFEPEPSVDTSALVETLSVSGVTACRTPLDGTTEVRLEGMSVFDSACAELYVNAQNRVQYLPPELRLLARLAATQDRMRRDVLAERQSLLDSRPSTDGYPADTEVGRVLVRLTTADGDVDLAALATLSEQQTARVSDLRALVAAAGSSTLKDDMSAARRDVSDALALIADLDDLMQRVDEAAAEGLGRAAANAALTSEAVALAQTRLDGYPMGVGSEPWLVLWDAARSFVARAGAAFPPAAGQACPLCLQPLSPEAASSLSHFEEHVRGYAQTAASRASAELAAALKECSTEHADRFRGSIASVLAPRDPALAAELTAVADAVSAHMAVMLEAPASASATTVRADPQRRRLTAWVDHRAAHARALEAADDSASLRLVTHDLAELEARERLARELPSWNAWRANAVLADALSRVHTGLATNRISSAQRELTERVVGKALDAALSQELQQLSCTHLPVELGATTAVAETRVQLRLLSSSPVAVNEVVSEGEQRALALAFFFAELEVMDDGGGIIVDDPVSSMDDERRRYIADRLIGEAGRRQVVVFTHDLAFLFDLQNQAEAADVPLLVQGLWRLGNDVGRVDQQPPFKAMKLKGRVGNLKERVARWDAEPKPASVDEAWRRVTAFYSDLRTAWERAVEERLFQGVVQRFQRSVQTLKLKNVEVTPALVAQIEQGMSRASMFVHDQPTGGAVPLPTRSVAAADLQLLVDFEASVKPK